MRLSFSGAPEAKAPRALVWQRLMDPQFVAAAAPGVERVDQLDDSHFRILLGFGFGAIKLNFTLDVELVHIITLEHVTMQAQGNAPGSAVGVSTRINLAETGPSLTMVQWQSECDVTGILANVGGHFLEGTARTITERFWLDFADRCARVA